MNVVDFNKTQVYYMRCSTINTRLNSLLHTHCPCWNIVMKGEKKYIIIIAKSQYEPNIPKFRQTRCPCWNVI